MYVIIMFYRNLQLTICASRSQLFIGTSLDSRQEEGEHEPLTAVRPGDG